MPVYTDDYCDVDYETLSDADFNTVSMLPDIFQDACKAPVPSKFNGGDIKLATVRILRFKAFSGVLIFVSLAHGVVDGHGQLAFMNRWSEISKALQGSTNPFAALNYPERLFAHDRSINSTYKYDGTDELDPDTCKALSVPQFLSKWLAWTSLNTRGRLINAFVSLDPPKRCYFRIRKQTVESLRNTVQDHAFDSNLRYSHNDIITALATTAIVHAMRKHEIKLESRPIPSALRQIFGLRHTKESEKVMASFAVDIRPRIDNTEATDYMGNLIVVKDVKIPLEFVQLGVKPKALSAVASGIRQAVNSMSKRYIGQYSTLLNKCTDGYLRAILNDSSLRYGVFVTNHTRFGHYTVDFGAGIPSLVRPCTLAFPNIVFIMPCHPDTDAYEFAMPLTSAVRKNIVQDKSWMQLVEKYSFDV
ncbi:hypothetical protein IW140_005312 [Coemansia sp. RSA 1813]|nr:hypothetical protein EV178_005264 [Coemansia sp. RSA 1646]KAJ2087034.1 hypothetical protein IW138_005253 [Coemansia sp. RSA 986]KAJ2211853.1 hypothetical protein EV179_005144 [Coemansia sp. RSA 487]KAJ2565504.1 hypothetical protein IW140_005312 [Coemansia sp. RSA 1813]